MREMYVNSAQNMYMLGYWLLYCALHLPFILFFFCSYFPHHLWGGLDSALFPNSFLPLSSSRVKSLRNMESSKRSTSGVGSQDKGRNIRKTGNREEVKMPTGFEKS